MGQNVSLPHLGLEQFGRLYYLSPLTNYLSGFAGSADEFMDVFIWSEEDNGRGSNQIVSCFYLYLVVSFVLEFFVFHFFLFEMPILFIFRKKGI